MIVAHQMQHSPGSTASVTVTIAVIAAVVAAGYLGAAVGQRTAGRTWSTARIVVFLAGVALVVLAFVPRLTPYAEGTFAAHMYQHLLIGMFGPLGIVLGAPLTLTLRTLGRRHGRRLVRLLRSRPARLLANPGTALLLNLGGLAVLYFSPLYDQATDHLALHHLVHAHFFLAGVLFAWVVAGPDPAPHRPSVPQRLGILAVAIAAHAVISQLLYAGLYTSVDVPAADLRAGGSLMYFGGDIAELLLALALVTRWRPQLSRTRRDVSAESRPSPA